MLPTLPLEIYGQIILEVATNADLLSLSLCCWPIRDEAQRKLFADPHMEGLGTRRAERQSKFIKSIVSSPARLGPMVRTYTHHEGDPEEPAGVAPSDATAALRAMCNLKELALYTNLHKSRYVAQTMHLDGCTFSLDAFQWHLVPDRPLVLDIQTLYRFLSTQPRLKHLSIMSQPMLIKPDAGLTAEKLQRMCPKLRSLKLSNPVLLERFLCGDRPISHLQWTPDSPVNLTVRQFARLEYLELHLSHCSATPLYGAHLTSLTVLDALFSSLKTGLLHVAFLEAIPRLRTLIIRTPLGCQPVNDEEYKSSVRNIFSRCKALQQIYVQASPEVSLFERFLPPDSTGQMEHQVIVKDDVYSWRNSPRFK